MDKFVINGGNRLHGEVSISGAKNAALAIVCGSVLCDGICRIENIPDITDVASIVRILDDMGAKVRTVNRSTIEIDPTADGGKVRSEKFSRIAALLADILIPNLMKEEYFV